MRIKEIKAEGLFGMFNHTIPLNSDSRITIIYGENGIGKTMIFKLMDWIFSLSLPSFIKLIKAPFDLITVLYEDNSSLTVSNTNKKNITFTFVNKKGKETEFSITKNFSEKDIFEISNSIERHIPLRRISENKFMDFNTRETFSIEEVLLKYGDLLPPLFSNRKKTIPAKLKEIISQTNLYFIQTQRLFSLSNNNNKTFHWEDDQVTILEDTATRYSNELSTTIRQKTSEYRKLSDDLKNSLGQRILSKKVKMDYSVIELQELADTVEEKRKQLQNVGLIENFNDNFHIPDDILDVDKAILAVNIQDMQTQLKVYENDSFYDRLKLFIEILNERRLSYKKISISEKNGFSFRNINGEDLKPKDLSSGEQHELVLLYQLLFKIPENSLILLDEPEISLHISWQKEFILDMDDIINLRGFDILLATHSPSIINGNWDLTVSLKGENDDDEETN